jgi:AcrR family transcriptional regulator
VETKKKPELRVRRTRKHLWKAFIELITEKGYDSVTVKDITDRAMVNRVTFYRHYEDKHDLLMRGMDEILDDLVARTEPPLSSWQISLYDPPNNALEFFQHVKDYAEFYKVMMGDKGTNDLINRVRHHIDNLFQERILLVQHSNATLMTYEPLVPVDLAVFSISSTVLAMMRWWLDKGLPCSVREIAMYTTRLIVLGAYRSIGVDVEIPRKDISHPDNGQ